MTDVVFTLKYAGCDGGGGDGWVCACMSVYVHIIA